MVVIVISELIRTEPRSETGKIVFAVSGVGLDAGIPSGYPRQIIGVELKA